MSGLSFLAPIWALMGLIALPIILLYLLRRKRPDLKISSTILWSKALADMRASTPFQKLRRNLLLLLQLLILAALVFTLMRPVVQANASRTEAGVIVIDATASMQTRDGGATESRLDRAKIEAKALVDRMRPGDKFMLIADGGGMNQVRSGFSSSKSELKSLIDSIKPSDTPSDLSESLLLAATSLRAIGGGPGSTTAPAETPKTENIAPGTIWLFSDGAGVALPESMALDAGSLAHVKIGNSERSVGITRLSIQHIPKEDRKYQVFVGIRNNWPVEKRVGVVLAHGTKDNLIKDQGRLATIPPNSNGSVVFESVESDPGKIFALIDDTDDDFPLDNTAFGILAPPRKLKVVLVTPGNEFLERLVRTTANVGTTEGTIITPEFYNQDLPADLFILDGFLPPADKMPKVDTIIVRPTNIKVAEGARTADVGGFTVIGEIERPAIMHWRREEPALQYVELGDLTVYKSLLLERSGTIDLIMADGGPIAAYKDFGPVRRYFVGFSPVLESTWWRQPSLIIFLRNVMEETRSRNFIGMPQLVTAGNPARVWNAEPAMRGDKTVRIDLPQGATIEIPAKDGTAEFGATDHLGFYQAHWPGAAPTPNPTDTLFAVNLLNQPESDIRPRSLQGANNTPATNIKEVDSIARVNREIWHWLAIAALILLTLEWWAYHRRIG